MVMTAWAKKKSKSYLIVVNRREGGNFQGIRWSKKVDEKKKEKLNTNKSTKLDENKKEKDNKKK